MCLLSHALVPIILPQFKYFLQRLVGSARYTKLIPGLEHEISVSQINLDLFP